MTRTYTSRDALFAARMAHVDKIANHQYDTAKTSALVYLYNYKATGRQAYLQLAIYFTQVALFIARLSKFN